MPAGRNLKLLRSHVALSLHRELCGGMVCRQYVNTHQRTRKCEKGREEWAESRVHAAAASNTEAAQEQEELEMEREPAEYVFSMPKGQEVPCTVR